MRLSVSSLGWLRWQGWLECRLDAERDGHGVEDGHGKVVGAGSGV